MPPPALQKEDLPPIHDLAANNEKQKQELFTLSFVSEVFSSAAKEGEEDNEEGNAAVVRAGRKEGCGRVG